MNTLAASYVALYLQDLHDGARQRPALPAGGPSLRRRIASAVSDARVNLAIAHGNRGKILRKFAD